MPMGTDKNKTKRCPYKERDPENHSPPRFRTEERSFLFELTSRCRAIQNYRPLDSISPGHFFLPLRLHVNTSTRCYPRRRFRVCSVVYTDVADCLLVAIRPGRPGWRRKKNDERINAAFSYLPEVDLPVCRGLSAPMARSRGQSLQNHEPKGNNRRDAG